ncbi:MAG: 23S rRNA (adenine(2030)-N(6))-methyltransferase RlmJ [Caulobacteraceae bacterium]
MNYDHAFHAGNFADVLKHAVLTALLRAMTAGRRRLTVIDTHAGAGIYDLSADAASRTGEAVAGVRLLMADTGAPAIFDDLKAEVRRANRGEELRWYPGSPLVIAGLLRPGDSLIACELRPDAHAALEGLLPHHTGAEILAADGWEIARRRALRAPAPLLVIIDPPFERGDDREKLAEAVAAIPRLNPGAVIAAWVPIKDLAGFDDLVGAVEDAAAGAPLLIAETRQRTLADPTRMNGCAMLVANPPPGFEAAAASAARWVAGTSTEPGAAGRAWFVR